jgi:hypothetical protein
MEGAWDGLLEIGRPLLVLIDDGLVFSSPIVRGFAVCGSPRVYVVTENSLYRLELRG